MGYSTQVDYRITCSVIETELLRRYPYAVPLKDSSDEMNHLLWVVRSIRDLDDQREINFRVYWLITKARLMGLLDKTDAERREEKALVNLDLRRD